jgi:hypothetical protein
VGDLALDLDLDLDLDFDLVRVRASSRGVVGVALHQCQVTMQTEEPQYDLPLFASKRRT